MISNILIMGTVNMMMMMLLMMLILMPKPSTSLPRIIRVGAIFTEDQKVNIKQSR